MKTLIFNGSPRKKGDTMSLLEPLMGDLEGETRLVNAYGSGIRPCVDCRWCRENPGCCIRDGMEEIYALIRDCDNILIASPIYFGGLTGELLSLLSRLQCFYSARSFRGENPIEKPKRGAMLLVGGGNGGSACAEDAARMALRSMNVRGAIACARSLATDSLPAARDERALREVREIAACFNAPR